MTILQKIGSRVDLKKVQDVIMLINSVGVLCLLIYLISQIFFKKKETWQRIDTPQLLTNSEETADNKAQSAVSKKKSGDDPRGKSAYNPKHVYPLAKEIRKDGESWKDAQSRARERLQLQPDFYEKHYLNQKSDAHDAATNNVPNE